MSKPAPPPEKIIVTGAGIPEINGEYRLSSARGKEGSPFYEMKGTWEGEPETFHILYTAERNIGVCWYSWWITRSSSRGVGYYSNPGTPDMPPRRGWWDKTNPTGGPPILSFDDEPPLVDWRQEDPDDNLSDFALEIAYMNPETHILVTKTYNVHKLTLAKTTEYFASLFRDTKKRKRSDKSASNSSIQITLPESAANMVPYLLDILYGISNNGMSVQSPRLASRFTGLYFLADYFQVACLCPELIRATKDRMLSFFTCSLFLSSALELGIEVIVTECVQFCSRHLLKMEFDEKTTAEDDSSGKRYMDSAAVVTAANVAFLLQVFQAAEMTEERSRKASEFAAAFCNEHAVDADDFMSLTDSVVLPFIDARVVWSLLKKETELLGNHSSEIDADGASNPTNNGQQLSSLQERCIDSLVHDFLFNNAMHASGKDMFDAQSSHFVRQYVDKLHARKKSSLTIE